jgi:hypothetical protein
MMRLQEDLERASTIARLEKFIANLQQRGVDLEWEPKQREWFLGFLFPFSQTQASSVRLCPDESDSMVVENTVVLEELLAESTDTETLERELEGYVGLYERLAASSPDLTAEDADRALRVARAVRSRLLATFPTSSPIVAADRLVRSA